MIRLIMVEEIIQPIIMGVIIRLIRMGEIIQLIMVGTNTIKNDGGKYN